MVPTFTPKVPDYATHTYRFASEKLPEQIEEQVKPKLVEKYRKISSGKIEDKLIILERDMDRASRDADIVMKYVFKKIEAAALNKDHYAGFWFTGAITSDIPRLVRMFKIKTNDTLVFTVKNRLLKEGFDASIEYSSSLKSFWISINWR